MRTSQSPHESDSLVALLIRRDPDWVNFFDGTGDLMELPTNPLALLTFISAPAVLTNASCVLLFGTGNRYGRAVDRVHELADMIDKGNQLTEAELRLRVRQLDAGERRALLIVRALTCFYTAVAGFAVSTLVSLIAGILVAMQQRSVVPASFAIAFLAGSIAVLAIVAGAIMLARETRYSFHVLQEERIYLTSHIQQRFAKS